MIPTDNNMLHAPSPTTDDQSDASSSSGKTSKSSGKVYNCRKCDATFDHRSVLKKHSEDVHADERVPCSQCDKTFTTRSSLRLHVEAIHDGVRYQCSLCARSFGQLGSLRRHVKSLHSADKLATGTVQVLRKDRKDPNADVVALGVVPMGGNLDENVDTTNTTSSSSRPSKRHASSGSSSPVSTEGSASPRSTWSDATASVPAFPTGGRGLKRAASSGASTVSAGSVSSDVASSAKRQRRRKQQQQQQQQHPVQLPAEPVRVCNDLFGFPGFVPSTFDSSESRAIAVLVSLMQRDVLVQ